MTFEISMIKLLIQDIFNNKRSTILPTLVFDIKAKSDVYV